VRVVSGNAAFIKLAIAFIAALSYSGLFNFHVAQSAYRVMSQSTYTGEAISSLLHVSYV